MNSVGGRTGLSPWARLRTIAPIALIVLIAGACGGESRVLQLTFDGEQCSYEGPSVLSAGEVEIAYHNESAEISFVSFVILDEGKTIQDMLDYIADSKTSQPSWTSYVWNREPVSAGESVATQNAVLVPGLHALVCGTLAPIVDYFGSGLTVEP